MQRNCYIAKDGWAFISIHAVINEWEWMNWKRFKGMTQCFLCPVTSA